MQRPRTSLTTTIALAVLTAPVVVWLSGCQTATPSIEPRSAGVSVKLANLRSAPLDDTSTYLAALKSRRSVPLRPQVPGEVEKIFVRSGDHVAKGQILIELDDAKQAATVKGLQANAESLTDERQNVLQTLHSLEATRQSRSARVDFCQQELTRYSDLFHQGAVSKENVDEHTQNLRIAQSDYQTLESQIQAQRALVARNEKHLKQCQAQITEQQAQLQYFVIKAPGTGVVGDVPVKVGEYVTSSTVLTTMEEGGPLEVYINVPADQSENLKIGLPVRLLNDTKILASGKVFFVSQEVNDADQSILVKAIFENTDGKLRTGQLVNVQVVWNHGQTLLVPVNAVVHLSGRDFVFVAQTVGTGGLVARQKGVELGDIQGEEYVLKSGLKSDDKIVLSGVQNLVDGAPLDPK